MKSDYSKQREEAFSQKMVDILNGGALNLAIAIGYRTGLFDVLYDFTGPVSVNAIAEKAGLNERYIREWLGVMMAAGIVEIDVKNGEPLYYLPREHAPSLTRQAGSSNMAVYAQEIPLLTTLVYDAVIEGFKNGEGISYTRYPKFQAFMTELSDNKMRRVLIEQFLPKVDGGELAVRLKKGITVCDLGCGEGVAVLLMAKAFPQSRFVGIDISGEAVGVARAELEKSGLKNAEFIVCDAAAMEGDPELAGAYDYVLAFDSIHDQTAPLDALKGVRHILKPGGDFSMIDIASHTEHIDNRDHPMGPFLYAVSLMHCMPVGLFGGGAGLGMMWGREKAVEMLKRAGFGRVEVVEMKDDPFNLHYYCRK